MAYINEELMKQFMLHAPANIFFKDTECRYLFASEICHLVNCGKDGTIIGKTDLEIQNNKELGKMYYEADKKMYEAKKAFYQQSGNDRRSAR